MENGNLPKYMCGLSAGERERQESSSRRNGIHDASAKSEWQKVKTLFGVMHKFEEPQNEVPPSEQHSNKKPESDNRSEVMTVGNWQKWKDEKERFEEIIEYIREVDEILNLIRPFPRCSYRFSDGECQKSFLNMPDSQDRPPQDRSNHLENIIKIVEQLKELQENNLKVNERNCFIRDLKKLHEHKKKLICEEIKLRSQAPGFIYADQLYKKNRSQVLYKRSKSTSDDIPQKEKWEEKRKSIGFTQNLNENKSKVSKWSKVKEAFHWEKTSHMTTGKGQRKEIFPIDKMSSNETRRKSMDNENHSSEDGCQLGFDGLPLPPPPPSPLPRFSSSDFLSVHLQNSPLSSSSDKLGEVLFSDSFKGNDSPIADFSNVLAGDIKENVDNHITKSCSNELILSEIPFLCKEELASSRFAKMNKSTWNKVKDIIQTRKGSLKKKSKKRTTEDFKKRRKSCISTDPFSNHLEDLGLPEEKYQNLIDCALWKNTDGLADDPFFRCDEENRKRKGMPALTVTVPSSTREVTQPSCSSCDDREEAEGGRVNSLTYFPQFCEEKPKFAKSKLAQNQRLSSWIKVKKVFLTSSNPIQSPSFRHGVGTSPTGHNNFTFFSDVESDDLSSGEWMDDKSIPQEKLKLLDTNSQNAVASLIHDDIRKSYNELQKKLTHEFDQKLREWEINVTSVKQEDSTSKSKTDEGDVIPKFRKNRECISVPLPNINDLSPEFKKKLNDWKKIKTCQSSSTILGSTKEDIQGQNSKLKIGEWQAWKSRCSVRHLGKSEIGSLDEFKRKVEDVQKEKTSNLRPLSNRTKDNEGKESLLKKGNHSRSPSAGDSSLNCNSTEKDRNILRRVQKVKDFQWVQKELQRIEKEKTRLDQEKEKYLEKEARLEKMKITMGTSCPTQEVIVRTPSGFIRFKGISQKFTKRLYEWEKARGIAPEASTFALIEKGAITTSNENPDGNVSLKRSMSMGSVPELSASLLIQGVTHHPSSLSLNDVDELKALDKEDSLSCERLSREPDSLIIDVGDRALRSDSPPCNNEIPVYICSSHDLNQSLNSGQSSTVCGGKCIYPVNKNCEFSENRLEKDEVFEFIRIGEHNFGRTNTENEGPNGKEFLKRNTSYSFGDLEHFWPGLSHKASEMHTVLESENKPYFLEGENDRKTEVKDEKFIKSETTSSVIPVSKKNFKWAKSSEREITSINSLFSSGSGSGEGIKFDCKSHLKHIDFEENRNKNDSEMMVTEKKTEKHVSKKPVVSQLKYNEGNYHIESIEDTDHGNFCKKKQDVIFTEENIPVVPTSKVPQANEYNEEADALESVNVIVPTRRKIISPVKIQKGVSPEVFSYIIDDVKGEDMSSASQKCVTGESTSKNSAWKKIESNRVADKKFEVIENHQKHLFNADDCSSLVLENKNKEGIAENQSNKYDIGMPPLPNSPKSVRKFCIKETAPSIRMIIAKYNQKLSEKGGTAEKLESDSAKLWRSPVFGKRTQEKIEKYCKKEGEKNVELQKSASFDSIKCKTVGVTPLRNEESPSRGILKSCSADVTRMVQQKSNFSDSSMVTHGNPRGDKESSASAIRALKIQKAKEDFLSGMPSSERDSPTTPFMSVINGSSASHNDLVNISIGTSTENSENYSHQSCELSQNEKALKKSTSKFDISNIKSKFRKIKMRKDKQSKMSSVSVLCRQSLHIQIPDTSEGSFSNSNVSKSCPSSPVMDRCMAMKK